MNISSNNDMFYRLASELENYKRRVNLIAEKLKADNTVLDWDLGRMDTDISNQLKSIESELEAISSCFMRHANYIWDARYEFTNKEQDLIKQIENVRNVGAGAIAFKTTLGRYETSINKIFPYETIPGTKLPNLNPIYTQEIVAGQGIDKSTNIIEPWLESAAIYYKENKSI